MVDLFLRSLLVLALLFGLLFAIGMAVLSYLEAPLWAPFAFALGILLLQYLLGPWILELIYKIRWHDPAEVDPQLAAFIAGVCQQKGIPAPRFGVIEDGTPNAFTFGHYPGDARLVVTRGLLHLLDHGEQQAVVAHELGHIVHWDFVVMTVAAAVPLMLYLLYRATRGRGRRGRGAGYIALVGLVSYVAYIISHYIVLLLSRVREYYADRFAGEVTGDANALASALVKVAYGLAVEGSQQQSARLTAVRAFGIFDPRVAQGLALASAAGGSVSAGTIQEAMKWDLWNPWALVYELSSTHPLPAKRLRPLGQQSETQGRAAHYAFHAERAESYWDEFLVDLLFHYLPLLGAIAGVVIGLLSWGVALPTLGLAVLLASAGWWGQRRFTYRNDFSEERNVSSLVGEVKVSGVRAIPCTLRGGIIGRGVPGLFYSEDLVLQDGSGYITLDYRQPLRLLEFLFGWLRAEKLIGLQGTAMGWYRRAPRPHLELRRLILENGEKVTTYGYPLAEVLVYVGILAGLGLTFVRW